MQKRFKSLSAKLAALLVIQAAGTLLAVAGYYAYLGQEIRGFQAAFPPLLEDARLLHRRLDNPEPWGAAGRASLRSFVDKMDAVHKALKNGGDVQGTSYKPLPPETRELLSVTTRRWKSARAALLTTAAASDADEAFLRRKLHDVYPEWQADLGRIHTSLTRRAATVRAQMSNTFLLIGAVDLLFFALAMLLARRFITRPVQEIKAAAGRVAAGDYTVAVPDRGSDEIGSLAAEFNRMTAQLGDSVGSLQASERQLAEKAAALEHSNRRLEEYAYAAAHDLQEPVRILSLYVQMLVKRWPPPPEAADIAAQIQTSAERMRALISDLLLDSRSAHAPAEFGPADADQALDRALRQLRKEIDDADATVVRQPLPALLASEAELELVLRNLLSNALKYRSDSPLRIEIAADVEDGWCTISVRDNGIGIDPAYHERIFGLFRRLHGPAVPGTGIGLAVVRNVVEKCGGKVWLESEPGRGATFRFRLRTATAAAFSTVA